MKAAVNTRYGPPSVISVTDAPVPVPAPGQLLIRVRATTVNRTDSGFLRARPPIVRLFAGLRNPRSPILGCEYAGEVVELGPGVTGYSVGDAVVGYDDAHFGGHAEYVATTPRGMVTHKPSTLDFPHAAAMLEGAHYSLFYIRAAGVGHGSRVLVNGGTGAIGSAAVQILVAMGADVTAVCGTEHLDLVRSLGASRVLSYQTDDFTRLDETFDLVFDAVGKRTFAECRRVLTRTGSYASTELGPKAQNPALAVTTRWSKGQRMLFPIPSTRTADAEYLRSLAEAGKYTPLVDRTYPLEEIRDAYDYVETGQKVGNVVVLP